MGTNFPPAGPPRAGHRLTQAGGSAVAPEIPPTAAPEMRVAPAPKLALPKKVVCPVCTTTFAPRASAGRCPVCGDQVIPIDQVARNLPVITPVANWMFQQGNWRLVAVGALILYQIIIFIVLWIHLAQIHAL